MGACVHASHQRSVQQPLHDYYSYPLWQTGYKVCLSVVGACYATTLLAVPVAACVASGGIYVHNSKPDLLPSSVSLVSVSAQVHLVTEYYVRIMPSGTDCWTLVGDPCPGSRPDEPKLATQRRQRPTRASKTTKVADGVKEPPLLRRHIPQAIASRHFVLYLSILGSIYMDSRMGTGKAHEFPHGDITSDLGTRPGGSLGRSKFSRRCLHIND